MEMSKLMRCGDFMLFWKNGFQTVRSVKSSIKEIVELSDLPGQAKNVLIFLRFDKQASKKFFNCPICQVKHEKNTQVNVFKIFPICQIRSAKNFSTFPIHRRSRTKNCFKNVFLLRFLVRNLTDRTDYKSFLQ
jgi:hypothetical protein